MGFVDPVPDRLQLRPAEVVGFLAEFAGDRGFAGVGEEFVEVVAAESAQDAGHLGTAAGAGEDQRELTAVAFGQISASNQANYSRRIQLTFKFVF